MGEARPRYPTLDLLRVIAVSMTMLTHTPSLVSRVFFLRPFQHGLWLGVDLFMLISGWLLGGQLLADPTMPPIRFYVKRWIRTLPPYYVVLLSLYWSKQPQFGGPLPWKWILTHVFFLQGYVGPLLFMVSWSLCVEEHFYLLLPVLVIPLSRRPRLGWLLSLVIGFEVMGLVGRVLTVTPTSEQPFASFMRCDGLFLGLAFAWLNRFKPDLWASLGKWTNLLAGAGVLGTLSVQYALSLVPNTWMYVAAPTLGTWTLSAVFLAAVHPSASLSKIRFPGLQYAGELTYGIYLIHDVIPKSWMGARIGEAGIRAVLVRLSLVVLLSVGLHHLVERPALRFRGWLMNRWSRPSTRAAGVDAAG